MFLFLLNFFRKTHLQIFYECSDTSAASTHTGSPQPQPFAPFWTNRSFLCTHFSIHCFFLSLCLRGPISFLMRDLLLFNLAGKLKREPFFSFPLKNRSEPNLETILTEITEKISGPSVDQLLFRSKPKSNFLKVRSQKWICDKKLY